MKNKLIPGIFFFLCAMQIVVPLSMITQREETLKKGLIFNFKTAAIDPFDAFRGRYVALRIEEDSVPLSQGVRLSVGQEAYASIAVKDDGFAKFASVTLRRPQRGPYILVKIRGTMASHVLLDLPMDRYYMEESAAPVAEKIYREHAGLGKKDAYVVVRVRKGMAVIEELRVGGKRIEEAVKDEPLI
jgi:uncharacterized membrane-anchored protein